MRAIPSFTSRTVPTSSTSSSLRSAASISRRRMSLISPGRSVVSAAIGQTVGKRRGRRSEAILVELVKIITKPGPGQPTGDSRVVEQPQNVTVPPRCWWASLPEPIAAAISDSGDRVPQPARRDPGRAASGPGEVRDRAVAEPEGCDVATGTPAASCVCTTSSRTSSSSCFGPGAPDCAATGQGVPGSAPSCLATTLRPTSAGPRATTPVRQTASASGPMPCGVEQDVGARREARREQDRLEQDAHHGVIDAVDEDRRDRRHRAGVPAARRRAARGAMSPTAGIGACRVACSTARHPTVAGGAGQQVDDDRVDEHGAQRVVDAVGIAHDVDLCAPARKCARQEVTRSLPVEQTSSTVAGADPPRTGSASRADRARGCSAQASRAARSPSVARRGSVRRVTRRAPPCVRLAPSMISFARSQHVARVLVREQRSRFIERRPAARRDPFFALRQRRRRSRSPSGRSGRPCAPVFRESGRTSRSCRSRHAVSTVGKPGLLLHFAQRGGVGAASSHSRCPLGNPQLR